MFFKNVFFLSIILFLQGCSTKEDQTYSIIDIPKKIIFNTPKTVETFVEKKVIPVVSKTGYKDEDSIPSENQYKVGISSVVYSKNETTFDLDSYSTMKIKNWLLGINENRQEALIGYVYEDYILKYSVHNNLFGISNLESNEKTHYLSIVKEKQIFNGVFGTVLDLGVGTSSKSDNVSNNSNLYGYGYKTYYETYGFGLMYQENISVKSGEVSYKNKESFSFINSNSFEPDKDVVFYKNFFEKEVFINVGIKERLNKENSNSSQMFFNLNYPF